MRSESWFYIRLLQKKFKKMCRTIASPDEFELQKQNSILVYRQIASDAIVSFEFEALRKEKAYNISYDTSEKITLWAYDKIRYLHRIDPNLNNIEKFNVSVFDHINDSELDEVMRKLYCTPRHVAERILDSITKREIEVTLASIRSNDKFLALGIKSDFNSLKVSMFAKYYDGADEHIEEFNSYKELVNVLPFAKGKKKEDIIKKIAVILDYFSYCTPE